MAVAPGAAMNEPPDPIDLRTVSQDALRRLADAMISTGRYSHEDALEAGELRLTLTVKRKRPKPKAPPPSDGLPAALADQPRGVCRVYRMIAALRAEKGGPAAEVWQQTIHDAMPPKERVSIRQIHRAVKVLREKLNLIRCERNGFHIGAGAALF